MTRSTGTTTADDARSGGSARHLREGLGRKQLAELGATMIEMKKKSAPRSPAQPSALKKAIDAVIS